MDINRREGREREREVQKRKRARGNEILVGKENFGREMKLRSGDESLGSHGT
jgi:hypothetical protein